MDPITLAILSAIAAGVTTGVTNVSENMIVDGYEALKGTLIKKLGKESDVVKAVGELEKKPDSDARKAVLQEEIEASKADQDPETLHLAEGLLESLKKQPNGKIIINQVVSGNQNIFSGTGNVTITNKPKE